MILQTNLIPADSRCKLIEAGAKMSQERLLSARLDFDNIRTIRCWERSSKHRR